MSDDATPTKPATHQVRGPYAKTPAVRQRILDACIEEFGSSGFHGATMKDIAQRAGISQTGLLHHFPTKAELLLGVLLAREEQETELAAGDDGGFHLIQTQPKLIRDNERRPGLIQLHTIMSSEATEPDHPAHELYRQRYDDLRTHLTREFTELRQQGRLKSDASPTALANLFVAVLDGLQLQWLYRPDDVDMFATFQDFLQAFITDEPTP